MKMHWVTCRINSSGQGYYIVDVLPNAPISWPEAQVLMAIHGEENVYEIKPVFISDSDPRAEKERLFTKHYSGRDVEGVFPGRVPRMELLLPGEPEDQPLCDNDGQRLPDNASAPITSNGGDEDEEDDEVKTDQPAAVFKPGRHPRPNV